MTTIKVLVVDDEFEALPIFIHGQKGFVFHGVNQFDLIALIEKISEVCPTVLLLDILDGDGSEAGIALFEDLKDNPVWQEKKGSVQIVFFSSEATQDREIRIARENKIDVSGFISKADLGEPSAVQLLKKAHEKAEEYKRFPTLGDPLLREAEIIFGLNSPMEDVLKSILMAGKCMEPVLIQGETGTGKELVAKAVFRIMEKEALCGNPLNGTGKFIPYNIGAAPREGNLQCTELFGALKGSYSGCDRDRIGLFEKATLSNDEYGGTIFLDEIGDAPSIIQDSLLRVIQENRITPLGGFSAEGEVERRVKFRLITASNVNLPEAVIKGGFRADLYYRLNTILIKVPPLRERKGDIPVLASIFLDKMNEKYHPRPAKSFKNKRELFAALQAYDWPGNVRQLEMAVANCHVMSPGTEVELSPYIREMLQGKGPTPALSAESILESLEENPRTFPAIAKEFGQPIAKEVGRLFIQNYGRYPGEEESQKLFLSGAQTCRKWLSEHDVKSRKIKK